MPAMQKEVKAYAKLNLMLDVIRKREDSYHEIRSVMQTIDLYDSLLITATPSDCNSILLKCKNPEDFPDVKWDHTNLLHRAADLILSHSLKTFAKAYSVEICIKKNIPSGAGMGGGSADAAAVLKGLSDLLSLSLSKEELCEMGKNLGADVPFCIMGGTVLCEGIGEIMTPLPFPGPIPCVVLKPQVSLSTGKMYELTDSYIGNVFHPSKEEILSAINNKDTDAIFASCVNLMEPAALSLCPEIKELCDMLKNAGARTALMTGSGSAVFGLFDSDEAAKKAFEGIDPPKAAKFISHFYGG